MSRTPSGRKHLKPLHGGPWLVEQVFVPAASITLTGVALILGIAFVWGVWKQAANAFSVFLLVAGVILVIGGPVVGCLGWLLIRTGQTCPDCLRGMNRGAYVCPWCGFRETSRKEQP